MSDGPILVVDDDADIRDLLEMALHSRGYTVETAVDGVEAIRRLSHGPRPSLVLLDIMMPHMDGKAVLAEIRNSPVLFDIPVVLLSGDRSIVETAAQLRSDGFLVKPIGLATLANAVGRFVEPASTHPAV